MERTRKKLRKAVKEGDSGAIRKMRRVKKSAKKRRLKVTNDRGAKKFYR